MASYWTDKVVLVTGGSGGLGWAISQAYAQAGAHVVLADLNQQQLDNSVAALQAEGREALGVQTDVTNDQQVTDLIAAAKQRFGRLDVLVNNVGISARGELLSTPVADFEHALQINFLTGVRCTLAAAPLLLESQGHIVNIGSLAAKSASRFLATYAASKFPVAAYSQQLRLELKSKGVHVLLVCPGPLARPDAGARYDDQADGLPESARRPGGGVKLKGIPPTKLAKRIVRHCELRKPELVMPARARLLFAISQLSPTWGDWIIGRMT